MTTPLPRRDHGLPDPPTGRPRAADARTIPGLLRAVAARVPDCDALVDDRRRLSYAGFQEEASQVARAVMARGLGRGDRVAIWAPNAVDLVVAFVGITAAGATVVPVNTRFKAGELADALERSGASLVLTVSAFLGVDCVDVVRSSPGRATFPVVTLDDGRLDDPHVTGLSAFLRSGDAVSRRAADERAAAVRPDDTACIILTSGTTGHPKGVCLSHRANLHCVDALVDAFEAQDGDRAFLVLPFFHVFGINAGFLMTLGLGGCSVIASVFDPATMLRAIEAERITYLPGPPTIHAALLDATGREAHDTSSLRTAFVASTVVAGDLMRRILDEGLARKVVTGYGLTEAGGTVALTPPGATIDEVVAWAGTVAPTVELRVVDDEGRDLPAGEAGELLVRSPMLMDGYVGDPEATAAAIDADGWLWTGDVGVTDGHGRVRMTDRRKDLFIVGGFNAYPAEIERILMTHPAVAQVAVVGMPDERLGEVGAAFVVARDPGLTAEEVHAYAREHLANYKVPRHVEVVASLPMTPSFKVQKEPLRERARLVARRVAG